MNYFDFQQESQELYTHLEQFKETNVYDLGINISKYKKDFIHKIQSGTDSAIPNVTRDFRGNLKRLIDRVEIGYFFVELNSLKTLINSNSFSGKSFLYTELNDFKVIIGQLWTRLEIFISQKSIAEALKFADSFDALNFMISTAVSTLRNIESLKNDLINYPEDLSGLEKLDLVFSEPMDKVEDLILKLQNLQKIYSEVCLLYDVNETEFPLLIGKVETGTLLTTLFGKNEVIDFIIWFIKSSIKYLHRNFTVEGKKSKIPTDISLLKDQFDLLIKIKQTVSADQYNELIKDNEAALIKSVVIISKQTQKLLEKETKMKFDGETIELNILDANKELGAGKKHLKEDNN